jgi:hypothetical protein
MGSKTDTCRDAIFCVSTCVNPRLHLPASWTSGGAAVWATNSMASTRHRWSSPPRAHSQARAHTLSRSAHRATGDTAVPQPHLHRPPRDHRSQARADPLQIANCKLQIANYSSIYNLQSTIYNSSSCRILCQGHAPSAPDRCVVAPS